MVRRSRRGQDAKGRTRWTRGRVLASSAALTAAVLAFPRAVPNTFGNLGSLLEAFLPWLGLAVPALLLAAVLRRSATALVALLLPVTVWTYLFGGRLLPGDAERADITVAQHNVSDENGDPEGTAKALLDAAPDLIALEELTPSELPRYERTLAAAYPHHAVEGTVGLWSRYPLTDVRLLDIRPRGIGEGWDRGLRAGARTPWGEIAVYVAHLPSVRMGPAGFASENRDESAGLLGEAVEGERAERVLLLGDLNGTLDDRGLSPVTSRLESSTGRFAFSWPTGFPVSRIDHVLARGADVTGLRTLPATGSDHLPVVAGIRFGDG
nr:endonuclease/exonuclease/phosphatase family protein [Streptomyces geranii]